MGVVFSIKLVVNYVIDTGDRHRVPRLECFVLVRHVGFLLLLALRTVACLLNYDSQAIGNNCYFGVLALTFIRSLQRLVKSRGEFHVHVGYQLRLYQV